MICRKAKAVFLAACIFTNCSAPMPEFISAGRELSDAEMIKLFNANENEFDQLNLELEELGFRGLRSIDSSWTDPRDLTTIDITNQQLESLRKRLRKLSIYRGVRIYHGGLEYISFAVGLSVSGRSKGYYYSTDEPMNEYRQPEPELQIPPFVSSEMKRYPRRGSFTIYVRVKPNWYIFEDYED